MPSVRGFNTRLPRALALLLATAAIHWNIAAAHADDGDIEFQFVQLLVDRGAETGNVGEREILPTPITPTPSTPDPANAEATARPYAESNDALPDGAVRVDQTQRDDVPYYGCQDEYTWQWVPTGLIYHSYMAGPHEPRLGIFLNSANDGRFLGDATLGGRVGFLKYGNDDPVRPEGFQIDFYGAAIPRLDVKEQQDLDSCDYVFGLPFTYGNEMWQAKIGYAHLSSHLGDEFAQRNPGALANRVNYVRDSLVAGLSYYVVPSCRLYGEVGWAIIRDGHAAPFTSQFGTEISQPGPTGGVWVPFLAINGRVRDDDEIVGDVNIQAGWLQRGMLGQTLRFGLDYYNGKSSQSQFYNQYEQQIGAGLWFDF